MNLYEFEGKQLFKKHGIAIPKGVVVRRGDDAIQKYNELGIKFCGSSEEVRTVCDTLFTINIRGQYVSAVLIEEKLNIAEEHYISITYDTNRKQPMLIYSQSGGMDIEDVAEEKIVKIGLDVRNSEITLLSTLHNDFSNENLEPIARSLWNCFLAEDTRVVEINPLIKTVDGRWIAADAKVALDDDAFYKHKEWEVLEQRTMLGRAPTEREIAVKKIDEGEKYYQGTAGKYMEMDGDIAILFSGGGASIANMDALLKTGLKPANYTEYSGNPPREKVYALAKIVLSKPNLRGLWIAGGVANFTDIAETFGGIVDALDELKPSYPIVVRRAGPYEEEGMRLMRECAERNNLNMKLFGKETPMSDTATVLAEMIKGSVVNVSA